MTGGKSERVMTGGGADMTGRLFWFYYYLNQKKNEFYAYPVIFVMFQYV